MKLFGATWSRAMTISNIRAAFSTTGVYPFDRHAVSVQDNTPGVWDDKSLCEKTGLAFIPLYSPAHACSLLSEVYYITPKISTP